MFSDIRIGMSRRTFLPADLACQIYTWADNPAEAVVLRNADLVRLSLYRGTQVSSGLPIYQHGQWPCVFATVSGIIVGITEKDRKWEYLVDDGSHVIDITIHGRSIPESVRVSREPLASGSRVKIEDQLSIAKPSLEIGDLVRVTGKIWGRHYPAALSGGALRWRFGLDTHSLVVLNDDPTAESRHNLEAHRLLHDVYSRPFDLPSDTTTTKTTAEFGPDVRAESVLQSRFQLDLRRLGCPQVSLHSDPTIKQEPSDNCSVLANQTNLREGDSKRWNRHVHSFAVKRERAASSDLLDFKGYPTTSPPELRSSYDDQSSGLPSLPPGQQAPMTPTSSKQRHMRSPAKLRDSQCTQQTFRLHVQKFLHDFCAKPASLHTGSNYGSGPPAFTLSFLMRVKTLRELALRVVTVMIRAREKRRLRTEPSHLNGITDSVADTKPSESPHEKVRRLFEWCARKLVEDGFLVIAPDPSAEPGSRPRWPFDGAHAPQQHYSHADLALTVSGRSLSISRRKGRLGVLGSTRVQMSSCVPKFRPPLRQRRSRKSMARQLGVDDQLLSQLDVDMSSLEEFSNKPTSMPSNKLTLWRDVSFSLADSDDNSSDVDNVVESCDVGKGSPQQGWIRGATASSDSREEAFQVLNAESLLPSLLPILRRSHFPKSSVNTRPFSHQPPHTVEVDVDWALWQLKHSDERWRYLTVDCVHDALQLLKNSQQAAF